MQKIIYTVLPRVTANRPARRNYSLSASHKKKNPIANDPDDLAARLALAKTVRAEADAEAARLRADALAGRLIPRYLCDDLVAELRARLDACARHLDAAYGPGPSSALVDALDGVDAWWARRLDEAGVRVAMDGSP